MKYKSKIWYKAWITVISLYNSLVFRQHHKLLCCCCLVAVISNSFAIPWPSLWDFPGKNPGMGCHFLLQGIFLTQGSNSHLLLGKHILYLWATWKAWRQSKHDQKINLETHSQDDRLKSSQLLPTSDPMKKEPKKICKFKDIKWALRKADMQLNLLKHTAKIHKLLLPKTMQRGDVRDENCNRDRNYT